MGSVQLKRGREKSLLKQHPWIFSGAISLVNGDPKNGETVDILDADGTLLARGAYSHQSQIRVRVWTWDLEEPIDTNFFQKRIKRAIVFRQRFVDTVRSNACRLIYGESDGLPGLIVDRYDGVLIGQFLSWGPEIWKDVIVDLLEEITNTNQIYERSDVEVRKLEGLPLRKGILRGTEIPRFVEIGEDGLRYLVDIQEGQKTGFYLDQSANRRRLKRLSTHCRILDCFSYTGGFSISALAGNAKHVTAIDSSAGALELARTNLDLNHIGSNDVELIEGDVFKHLRYLRDQGRDFDLIVLDPPKFAPTASQAQRASRGYKDINLFAFKLLKPGGYLVTFSCSGGVNLELFQKIVSASALDAGVDAQIIEVLHQGYDHPISLNFPESAYLKGFIIRIM
jgi:23S rRNA (cytosine1962-C5)-methyltransferase